MEYTRQAVNNLVLITETNVQGKGINADFIYQIHQEHPREFLKNLQESQIPTAWEVMKPVFMWALTTWSVILSIIGLYMCNAFCTKRKQTNNRETCDIELNCNLD